MIAMKKWLLFLLFCPMIIFANNTDTKGATQQLEALLNKLRSYQADFSQNIVGSNSASFAQKSSGTVSIKRPNQFRWEINKPSKQIIIADGVNLWIYNPDLEQATKQPMAGALGNTPALLLSGSTKRLAHDYNVYRLDMELRGDWFVLTSKQKSDNNFTQITLHFIKEVLVGMTLKDSLGQETKLDFTNNKINHQFSSELFHFIPPKNVDVIKNSI